MANIITTSNWNESEKLLTTHISGDVTKEDIERWEQSLYESLGKIKENGTFKIFVNLHGFKAIDIEAHKRFRAIIPLTLAKYGWKCGYVDLFEEDAKLIQYSNERGIKCVAAAHAHQDETKIELYETRYSRADEHYFTDPGKAEQWIASFPLN